MTTPFRATEVTLFQPTQISGCTIWLDGADPNGDGTVPANGATVSSWTDKSSNGMTVSAVSSQPVYTTNLQNGLGALTFDGTKNLATGNVLASKFAGTTSNLTIFCVNSFSNTVTGGTYASPFCWANGGAYPRICLTVGNNADGVMMDVGASGTGRTTYGVPPPTFDNTFYMTSYWKDAANSQLNLNGSNKASSSTQDATGFASSNYAFNVGAAYGSSIWYMRGNVGEILFYNSTLSTQNFQTIEGYLAWKWGLQASLPSTHPYKQTPVYAVQPFPLVPQVKYGTSVTTYNPTNLSNCVLWLDGSDITTLFTDTAATTQVTANGQSVKCWKDKSTQANNATNSTNAPTALFSGQNGRTVLNFSSQYLNLDVTKLPTGTTQFSVFLVLKSTSTSTQVYFSWGTTVDPGSYGRAPQIYLTNYTPVLDFYGGTVSISSTASFNNRFFVNTLTTSSAANGWTNGTAYTTTNAAKTLDTGTSFAYLGTGQINNALYTPFYLAGQIAEVIVYSREVSTAERQQIEGYLQWKWGLSSTIPAANPYQISPPYSTNPFPLVPQIRYATNKYFLPTSIIGSTCTLWLDGADKSTITGSTVTSWTDKSGQGNTATASAGPTQSKYNNYPVLSFNGSSQFMASANTVSLTTHTLIAVHRPALTNGNSQGNTSLFRYQSGNAVYIVFPYMSGTTPRGYITTAAGTGAGSLDYQTSTLVENSVTTSLNIIVAVISSGNQNIYKDGIQQSSDTKTLTGATSDTLTIGRYTFLGAGSEYYQGDLAEMIIYNSALSINSRQQVEGYLAWKWGLQGSLPGSHPYKLWPPPP